MRISIKIVGLITFVFINLCFSNKDEFNKTFDSSKYVIPFDLFQTEINDSAKLILEDLVELYYDTTESNINRIYLVNSACPDEIVEQPELGVLRGLEVINYLEMKGVPRDMIFILDRLPFAYHEIDSLKGVLSKSPPKEMICKRLEYGLEIVLE